MNGQQKSGIQTLYYDHISIELSFPHPRHEKNNALKSIQIWSH